MAYLSQGKRQSCSRWRVKCRLSCSGFSWFRSELFDVWMHRGLPRLSTLAPPSSALPPSSMRAHTHIHTDTHTPFADHAFIQQLHLMAPSDSQPARCSFSVWAEGTACSSTNGTLLNSSARGSCQKKSHREKASTVKGKSRGSCQHSCSWACRQHMLCSMANSGCLLVSNSGLLPHSLPCPPAFLYLQQVSPPLHASWYSRGQNLQSQRPGH